MSWRAVLKAAAGAVVAAPLMVCGASWAQPAPPSQDFQAAMAAYHKLPDTPGTGAFPAIKAEDPAFPGHVVYRPADLGRLGGRKLPIVLWGNGGCTDDGAVAGSEEVPGDLGAHAAAKVAGLDVQTLA